MEEQYDIVNLNIEKVQLQINCLFIEVRNPNDGGTPTKASYNNVIRLKPEEEALYLVARVIAHSQMNVIGTEQQELCELCEYEGIVCVNQFR